MTLDEFFAELEKTDKSKWYLGADRFIRYSLGLEGGCQCPIEKVFSDKNSGNMIYYEKAAKLLGMSEDTMALIVVASDCNTKYIWNESDKKVRLRMLKILGLTE